MHFNVKLQLLNPKIQIEHKKKNWVFFYKNLTNLSNGTILQNIYIMEKTHTVVRNSGGHRDGRPFLTSENNGRKNNLRRLGLFLQVL